MFNWGRVVEEQIREAEKNGEFNDLAGQGKPLDYNDEETAFEGDLKMAHHILKNADALPFWIELDKEIRARQEHCRTLLARFKVPKAVIFAEIPKTSTGKIQKFRLREMAKLA